MARVGLDYQPDSTSRLEPERIASRQREMNFDFRANTGLTGTCPVTANVCSYDYISLLQ